MSIYSTLLSLNIQHIACIYTIYDILSIFGEACQPRWLTWPGEIWLHYLPRPPARLPTLSDQYCGNGQRRMRNDWGNRFGEPKASTIRSGCNHERQSPTPWLGELAPWAWSPTLGLAIHLLRDDTDVRSNNGVKHMSAVGTAIVFLGATVIAVPVMEARLTRNGGNISV